MFGCTLKFGEGQSRDVLLLARDQLQEQRLIALNDERPSVTIAPVLGTYRIHVSTLRCRLPKLHP